MGCRCNKAKKIDAIRRKQKIKMKALRRLEKQRRAKST